MASGFGLTGAVGRFVVHPPDIDTQGSSHAWGIIADEQRETFKGSDEQRWVLPEGYWCHRCYPLWMDFSEVGLWACLSATLHCPLHLAQLASSDNVGAPLAGTGRTHQLCPKVGTSHGRSA